MNEPDKVTRRDILSAATMLAALELPRILPSTELSQDEIRAIRRISLKINAGQVHGMMNLERVGGTKTTVEFKIEWTDPDVLMLRDRGLIG